MKKAITFLFGLFLLSTSLSFGQQSVARQWNEKMLDGIRQDFARPTVHARNLFHASVAMYDAWAAYDTIAETYLLGKTVDGFTCQFTGVPVPDDVKAAREEAMSFAVYRLMKHRFINSPGKEELFTEIEFFMAQLGYDEENTSIDYASGDPAALGNYIAKCIIDFGLQDGSNEQFSYLNLFYEPVNPPLVMEQPGNPNILDYNRWQPLTLDVFIDQSGNEIPFNTPDFLGPEWGQVTPFSLKPEDATIYQRDGFDYWVYHDPGPPAYLDTAAVGGLSEEYKWGHSLVALWSSHLDPSDTTLWDVSPASIGNIAVEDYPTDIAGLRNFYDRENGGDIGTGYELNPATGQPYEPQIVPRADYARVLAEFWADGPDSETPPGHWFTIINYVNDNPLLVKKFRGQGEVVDDLEWDVKGYLVLGGAMHDVAITSWGVKGWYDYVRPVSAIRGMADLGQSSDPSLPSFHPGGIPLVPGKIELVEAGDPLAGAANEHVGKIKLKAWRGPDFIDEPEFDEAGVDWILAENWWPYQRPSFVTPPFAGYVSGHSTFSRAAAEVLTALTGDPFFPGGMGEFYCKKNEFLVFENGPSTDVTLQWATYRDASDQCSLSRIWGGIHPPVDDMPGRLLGIEIGLEAFDFAEKLFYKDADQDGFLNYVDCDDNNAAVNPDAVEICDGIDNNCDGTVDEGFEQVAYWIDADGDGFGSTDAFVESCADFQPPGYVLNALDCDDSNAGINPDAAETCNGLDDNCDGMVDNGLATFIYYLDADGDGFGAGFMTVDTCLDSPPEGYVTNPMDCDDSNAGINPGMPEVCDGIDNDCSGVADDGLTVFTFYQDNDGDLFGNPEVSFDTCGAVDPNLGFVLNGFDCDDNNAMVNPGMEEVLDSLDNDCNGLVDDGITSVDELARGAVKLYPNPTSSLLQIEYGFAGNLPRPLGGLKVQVFRADGSLVKSVVLDFSGHLAQMDFSEMLRGVYWLVGVDENGNQHFIEKIVRL